MKNPVFSLSILALLTSSCGHSYYTPNLQNVPLFRQAGDNMLVVSSGSCVDDGSTMLDIQGAYALTNLVAVTGGYFSSKQEGNNNPESDFSNGSMYEIGAGIYKPLSKIGSFDLFGGFANGKQNHIYDTYSYGDYGMDESTLETGAATLRYNRFFVRSSIGLTTRVVDFAVSTRFTKMNYYDVNAYINGQGNENNTLSSLSGLSCWWFEPALTLRLGYSPVKLQLQVAFSEPLQEFNPEASSITVNLGLVFIIPQAKDP